MTTYNLKEMTSHHLTRASGAEKLIFLVTTYFVCLPLVMVDSTWEEFTHSVKFPLQMFGGSNSLVRVHLHWAPSQTINPVWHLSCISASSKPLSL
jgi:hypothetical protein